MDETTAITDMIRQLARLESCVGQIQTLQGQAVKMGWDIRSLHKEYVEYTEFTGTRTYGLRSARWTKGCSHGGHLLQARQPRRSILEKDMISGSYE